MAPEAETPPDKRARYVEGMSCAMPGCQNPVVPRRQGRPARFCSTRCRQDYYRFARTAGVAAIVAWAEARRPACLEDWRQ